MAFPPLVSPTSALPSRPPNRSSVRSGRENDAHFGSQTRAGRRGPGVPTVSLWRMTMLRFRWTTLVPLALGLGAFPSPAPDCPPYLVGVGDLPGDTFLSFANGLTPDRQGVGGGSNADDPGVPNDGDSATWQHANQGFRWFPPCTGAPQVVLEGFGYPFTGVHPESNAKGLSPDGEFVAGDATYGPSVPTTFKPV